MPTPTPLLSRSPCALALRGLVAALGLLAHAGAAGAQAPGVAASPPPLTLADAVRRATASGPVTQIAAGRRAELTGRARTEAQWANPVVELRRENLDSPLEYDDFATVTLPIDLLGRRFALRSALGATRERAAADSLLTVQAAGHAAARAWWMAWSAAALARIAAAQADLYDRVARIDSLRAAEGALSEAAALRMRIEARRAHLESGNATAAAMHARAALATLIGTTDLDAAVPDTGRPVLDPLPDSAAALAAAGDRHPELAMARAAERAAERRRAAESRGVLPDVGLTGGYKGTAGLSTSVIGVTVGAPLLNTNGGNRERSAGEWLLASADRRLAELRVTNGVRAALAAAHGIDAASRGFDDRFAADAAVVAGAAEAAYREGESSLVELLDAFRAAADARAALVRATVDRAMARLELRRAMGAPAVEVP